MVPARYVYSADGWKGPEHLRPLWRYSVFLTGLTAKSPLLDRPGQEGWLRDQVKIAKPPCSAQTGWLTQKRLFDPPPVTFPSLLEHTPGFDSQLLHACNQGGSLQAHSCCGAIRAANPTFCISQGSQDIALLLEPCCRRVACRRESVQVAG